LNNPKKEIDALMLQREIYKIQPSKYKNRSEGTFIEEGMKISRIGNTKTRTARIKKMDELDYLIKQSEMQAENESKLINEGRAKLQKELKDLEDIKEIKEEEGHLDETIVEEIASVKEEIFRLTKILANYGKGEIADIEKARSAVKNTINNSLGKIKESHSSLWEHLDSSIQRRTFCSYTPAKHISWVLSP
jgi:tRNA/tmRNA/rRNA uracil-C5-methylase (TrmA/RlmC/RlmD family)